LSKAGLATGLGMLTTPLVASAMPAHGHRPDPPLLCLADADHGLLLEAGLGRSATCRFGGFVRIAIGMLLTVRASRTTCLSLATRIVGLIMAILPSSASAGIRTTSIGPA
jgi:hypothetical protein